MCGIAGKLTFNPGRPVERALLLKMNAVQCHRGPDDDQVWLGSRVGLGQRRLSIIDISETGRQPMSNEDGSLWITYNGEIYNHLQLRSGLEQRGHRYVGTSDTETILHLYEEYGPQCVQHLRGMFAFALWDERRERLLLARDRFGKKPLVYSAGPHGLVFGSEIKAVLQDPDVPADVDQTALHHYLTYGYVPAPWTAFEHIRKLPPASMLIWENGNITVDRYWSLRFLPKLELSEAEAAERLVHLLKEATQLRLMSEVPLGAFLSGGIDSSIVVALMADAMSEPVKTFSIGFEDQSFNELRFARQVAQRYKTDHHEFTVTPDAVSVLPELVWAYGEPFADSSTLPTYYLSKMTRQTVTVALSGDGGDEAFAGYDRYRATQLAAYGNKIPWWLCENVILPVAHKLPQGSSRRDFAARLKRFLSAMNLPAERRYASWITLLDNANKERLYTPEFRQRMSAVDSLDLLEKAYAQADSPDFVERTQFVDIRTYLPDDLLVKTDIASMVHSLEVRSPFLDQELAEFAARLPARFKLRGRTSKYILRQAFRDRLPAEVLKREKQGFGAPLNHWFRTKLKPAAFDLLLAPRALQRGLLDGNAVQTMLEEHISGKANHGYQIWQLLCLELWFRTYIDRPRSELTRPSSGEL